jgi:GNAT superfamily N-acetyltransferase
MKYIYDVPMSTFFSEECGLLEKHWKELSNNPSAIILKPDVAKYLSLQDAGLLLNIVVYNDEDEMVGYAIIFNMPHIHYSDDYFAMVDVIYVSQEYRKSRIGIELIDKVEALCREKNSSVLTYHTKPEHAAIEKIIERKGYSHYENIFGKLLKEKT